MATPENLHKNIPNAQLHSPKDFSTAGSGTALRKGWDGVLKWEVPYWQDSVLDRVDMTLTPPTEFDGDRYILINLTSTVVNADWDGASENDIVEYDLDASAWVSQTPFFDITVRSQADLAQYYFDGTTWNDASGGGINNVVEDTTPQLGGDLDVQTNEITSTGSNNIGLHSNASAYVELGDNLGTNTFDIRDNASAVKAQFKSTGDLGVGKSASSGAWASLSTNNNNRAHLNLEGGTVDKTTPVDGDLWYNTTAGTLNFYDGSSTTDLIDRTESLIIAVSDETTALTTGTSKITFRMPYAFTLTDVRASLTTAGGTSGTTTVDINESGTSILSTKLTIDNTEKTSTTATTAVVISDSALADDAEITIDIDAITGGATEAGLKVYLIGNRA
jgi:hypothetical protein